MDYAAHIEETARHLARMTATEFARDHAKLRLQELVASDQLYAGLADLVRQERARMRQGAAA